VILKIVPEAASECAYSVHRRKPINGNEIKPEQKFDAAFGTILRIRKCLQRSKQAKQDKKL
jgi:hypothetical protein